MKGLSNLASVRQTNDENLRRRRKYEEDLKLKRKQLHEEFNNLSEKNEKIRLFQGSSNEIKVIFEFYKK